MTKYGIALAVVTLAGATACGGGAAVATSAAVSPSAVSSHTAGTVNNYNTGLDMCLCMEIVKNSTGEAPPNGDTLLF